MIKVQDATTVPKRIASSVAGLFDNLSIRAKLFAYAGLLIVLMLTLAGFVLYQVGEIRNRHIPARAAARDMEASLLTMRIHELNFAQEADSLNAEFYLKQQSASVDAWQANYREFEKHYAKLTQLFTGTTIEQELAVIQPLVTQYRDAFLSLNGAYRERGFHSFGREGVLRQRAEALQASLPSGAQAAFLRMHEAQDRFLLYHEPSSIIDFQTQATALRAQLTNENDRVVFDEYVRLFEEVVVIYKKIGLNNNEGIRGRLYRLTGEITPHIQTAEAVVLQSTSGSIASIMRLIYIASACLIAIAILMAVMLARVIVKKILLLSRASERIAAGNFNYRLPVSQSDELGKLSHSFNVMSEQLQKGQHALHEHAHALSQSVKRFELVSRAVNEAIYEWDVKKGELTWGQGLISVFGYRPPDKTTTIDWWAERIHPDDANAIDSSLVEHLRRHSEHWKKEYRFKKANGEYVYCLDRGFIEYYRGEAVRMVGSLVDISRQKALDQAKDEFISVASHQLRTPLGSIRWNLELLLEMVKTMPAEAAEYAHEAYTSTLRMTGLVNDLLSVARIEQNRAHNIPEKSDLVPVLKAAVTEMRPIAKRRNVRIDSSNLSKNRAELVIDPKRFREVVQNLLSNAVKYTPPKGKVTIKVESRAKDFIVTIADNGIGIPIEDQSKLFGKFYRASNVTKTDTEGSGLGLFVVRAYVEAWGGKIWFTSAANQGTTFYISIPHKPRAPKEM